ncbi:MAG: hypothetical protein U9R72_07435 [Chloroflexota bacterium]|nr:hypothetical protein [Chloroflexota bacterium]
MSERIVAQAPSTAQPDETDLEKKAALREQASTPEGYYRYLRSRFVPEDEAARQVDIAFGLVPPPDELHPEEYYRYLRSCCVPEDEAARRVDIAFGLVPPPPEPWE